MNKLINTLNSNYNIKVLKVITIQKKVNYIIKTNLQTYQFKKSFKGDSNILRQQVVIDHLIKNNFNDISTFILNKDNLPFISFEGDSYYLSNFICDTEIDINNNEHVLKSFNKLATFHKATHNVDFKSFKKNIITNNTAELSTILENFKNSKKAINKLKKKNNFDIYNIKNYNNYLELGQFTINELLKLNYNNIELLSITNNHLCHNSLKEESFLIKNNNIFITNFSKVSIGCQINDIVKFIIRYLTKNIDNSSFDYLTFDELITSYNKAFIIDDNTFNIIKLLCLFPYEYFDLVNGHYQNNKSLIFGMTTAKLEEVDKVHNIINNYINY